MSVVDASVWVSLLAADDVNHAASVRWIESQIDEGAPLSTPSLALVEITAAMTRRTGDAAAGMTAAARLLGLPSLTLVDLDSLRAQRAARIAARCRLKGADAVYVALADELGVPLVTWDREQRERSSAVAAASSPSDDLSTM